MKLHGIQSLESALANTLLLKLPNCTKNSMVEYMYPTLVLAIGAVLTQEGRPLAAYFNKALGVKGCRNL